MTTPIVTPTDHGFGALELTSEERDLLYKNLVIPAKLYSASVQVQGTGVRVFKRINPELFMLKVLENNATVINLLAKTRTFFMNVYRQFSTTEDMIILTNGLIVKGAIGFNPYAEPTNTPLKQVAYIKCLVDGVETVIERSLDDVVIVNTSLTEEELAVITLFEKSFIDSTEPATITDNGRTRDVLRTPKVEPVSKKPRRN